MQRYHKKIYFPDIEKLKALNNKLNIYNWQYSKHAIDNLKYRSIDISTVLTFINNIQLEYTQIFEYYKLHNDIEKLCYRISYHNNMDIIIVLSKHKKIITIYLNSANDKHYTLKENLYQSI